LLFNLLALVISAGISFRAVLFFTAYALSLWLYSHKVKKLPVVANVIKALLTFVPFFAVFIYYKIPHWGLASYAFFLFTLELGRALVKDVVFLKGDVIYNYPTVPVLTGRMGLKRHLMAINLSGWAFVFAIFYHSLPLSPLLASYLLCCMLLQSMTAVMLSRWLGKPQKAYWLHNLYKAILIVGIGLLPFL
jgi:4-hydroxybenzoate polyprenyltransferase